MPTELVLTTGDRFVVTEEPQAVDQELARRGQEGFFALLHMLEPEFRVVFVNPRLVVRFSEAEESHDASSPASAVVDAVTTSVRSDLEAGFTPEQVHSRRGRRRATYLLAIEEEARLQGELAAYAPTPEEVVTLRDVQRLRWERIAARVFGDARKTSQAKRLYDQAKGEGAASASYTGRGRRFPKMGE